MAMWSRRAAVLVGLLLIGTSATASAQNVSKVLSTFPDFSTFRELLENTGVISEVQTRSSLSILCPPNSVLDLFIASRPSLTTEMVADVIRYHILLQYLDNAELRTMQNNGGMLTTLYQTTGRANGLNGFVNISVAPSNAITVGPSVADVPPQATILGNITQYPYNYSFFQIDAVMVPMGFPDAQIAPASAPSTVPASSPATLDSPAAAPVSAPAALVPAAAPVAPVLTPIPSPVVAPVPSPSTAPVLEPPSPAESPVASPPAPPLPGPSVDGESIIEAPTAAPADANAAAYSYQVTLVSALASIFVAVLF